MKFKTLVDNAKHQLNYHYITYTQIRDWCAQKIEDNSEDQKGQAHVLERLKSKTLITLHAGNETEQQELSFIASLAVSQKAKPYNPAIALLGFIEMS